jgi:hypothetical protein
MSSLLPQTRGEALHNLAGNFPIGTIRNKTQLVKKISDNAAAAWTHHYGNRTSRFAWCDGLHGPKATLIYISNGPLFFAKEWKRLFMDEIVAKSHLFRALPKDILSQIIQNTEE